jgi:PTS system mannose-specific IIB component
MGPDDVKTLEKPSRPRASTFDVRKVPADSPESFDAMLKKAKTELAAAK